ncbi:MAG: VOC family protein [Myxococcota bacterium]|nr:VOC family protein [Myxococcota bacterium]
MRLHLHLRCQDLAASETFYRALLGEPDKRAQGFVRFQPQDLGISLSLMEGAPAPLHAPEHLGMKVGSVPELGALWERLDRAGLKPRLQEDNTACCAGIQSKRWYVDPDGRAWEVYTVLDDSVPADWSVPRFAGEDTRARSCSSAPKAPSLGCCG